MSSSANAVPSLDGYQLRLPNFEGPLDVLLRLIERDQLEISDLSLLAVFDQFMAYLHALDAPPPAVIAEFVAVAGRMSVLKSRALLPKPPRPIEEADEPDLVRQLAEYRAVKAAAHGRIERRTDPRLTRSKPALAPQSIGGDEHRHLMHDEDGDLLANPGEKPASGNHSL